MPQTDEPAGNGVIRRVMLRIVELVSAFQFAALFVLAGFWFWSMPKGFPITHPRFWMNSFLPIAGMLASAWAIRALWRAQRTEHIRMQFGVMSFVTAATVATYYHFPHSTEGRLLAVCVNTVCGVTTLHTIAVFATSGGVSGLDWRAPAMILAAIGIGTFIPYSQQANPPASRPLNTEPPQELYLPRTNTSIVKLNSNFVFRAKSGTVIASQGSCSLQIEPALTFQSTSPDKFWTIFAPRRNGQSAMPFLGSATVYGQDAHYLSTYGPNLETRIELQGSTNENRIRLDATRNLIAPIYSHLNTYSDLWFQGDEAPFISFSPCPEKIAVQPSDYPTGRPARFAALLESGEFVVVEASSGEKGPFKTLTKGRLDRGDPLTLTLWNGETPAYEVTFHDWAAQTSTQLSPTAGWGMPENAIEFSSDHDGHSAMIFLTLAGTSVGRGWDSVGHTPGIYRNRMTLEILKPAN